MKTERVTKTLLLNYISSIYNIKKTDISIEQLGSKQLFIAKFNDNILLYSYYTIVGIITIDRWALTNEKYSTTTSKQLTYFKRYVNNCYKLLTAEQFNRLLSVKGLTV